MQFSLALLPEAAWNSGAEDPKIRATGNPWLAEGKSLYEFGRKFWSPGLNPQPHAGKVLGQSGAICEFGEYVGYIAGTWDLRDAKVICSDAVLYPQICRG